MPTADQQQNVQSQIEQLEELRYTKKSADAILPVFQGTPPSDAFAWSELVPDDKLRVMDTQINWEGFNRDQQLDVMQNVIDGKGAAHWMDGVDRPPSSAYERALDEASVRANGRTNNPEKRKFPER